MHVALWLGIFGVSLALPAPPSPLAWSPDGQWLAYVQETRPGQWPVADGWLFQVESETRAAAAVAGPPVTVPVSRLWTTRPDTGESVLLEEFRGPLTGPCWNREGTSLAFGRLVNGSDLSSRWEIVIQDAPDRQRVLIREPIAGPIPSPDTIRGLTLAWSPDGRTLAVPKIQPLGLCLVRTSDGRVERNLEGATQPRWAPNDPRLAYVRVGKEPGLYLLDLRQETRRLSETASESDRLPAPVWSRDGQILMSFRRTLGGAAAGARAGRADLLQLVRFRVDTGQIDASVNLVHDPIGREGMLLGSWFTIDPDGEDLYYATSMLDQKQAQITWSFQTKPDEVHKRFNPFDESEVLGALAACPGSRGLACRVGKQGVWSPPAVCDPEADRLILLTPDEDSRTAWLGRILETLLPVLRDQVPAPILSDGTSVERPSLLPSPGEFEPGDAVWLRLRRLARMGLKIVGPSSPKNDELRLAFAYLAEDDRAAMAALDAMLSRTESPEQRLRLFSVRAQILVMRRDFESARPLIEYLRRARVGPSHEIEEGIYRPKLSVVADPRNAWPKFLTEKIEFLKKPPAEFGQDLVPQNALDLDGVRAVGRPEAPAAPKVAPF